MITVTSQRISPHKVLLNRGDFEELIKKANMVESITVREIKDDIPVEGIMKLIETDKAFDFLNNPQEDIYTLDDLKERYR
ncbi:hypothetical protein KKC52_08055 [bacterium]|nr:hypothetical protein [bacterium]